MSQNASQILLIEDDKPILNFIKTSLLNKGFEVIAVETGEAGLAQAARQLPDIVITDLGLPDMDGIAVITSLREWTDVPIIVLSAREKEKDKLKALENGADDYLTKPFSLNELLARMRVSLRHASILKDGIPENRAFTIGNVTINLDAKQIVKNDQEIHLTENEFKLLTTLLKHKGKVLTQRFLINEVWGPTNLNNPQYLQIFMASLRRKFEDNSAKPCYIVTDPGIGYRFVDELELLPLSA